MNKSGSVIPKGLIRDFRATPKYGQGLYRTSAMEAGFTLHGYRGDISLSQSLDNRAYQNIKSGTSYSVV